MNEVIHSLQNPRVKNWKKLLTAKGRKQSNCYLIEGWHLVEEALRSETVVCEVLVDARRLADYQKLLADWPQSPLTAIDKAVCDVLTTTQTPPGIWAVVQHPYGSVPQQWPVGRYVALDGVQDPGNVGTIIRTADALGFAGVLLGKGTADHLSSKVLRAMQGSQFHLPVYQVSLPEVLPHLQQAGMAVYGTQLSAQAQPLPQIRPETQCVLVVGNEGQGVSADVLQLVDAAVFIPMAGRAESLNVAVAAGILMYQMAQPS